MLAVYLEFFLKNIIICSSQRVRHVCPVFDPHFGRASGEYVVFAGKKVKLPGTQDMFALFWFCAGRLSMTLTQR